MDHIAIINQLKEKDLKLIKDTISKMMLENNYGTTNFTSFLFKGFYRARKHNHVEGKINNKGLLHKFTNESEFWNVPKEYAQIGRCNEEGESMFYCANDIVTAILEVKPEVGDFVTVSNFNNLFPNMKYIIQPVAIRSLSKIPSLKNQLLNRYIFNQKHQLIEDLLDVLFCGQEENLYKLSIAVSHLYLTDRIYNREKVSQTHGLIYPSIIRNQTNYCFALKPWFVHSYFEIFSIQTIEILEITDISLKLKLIRNGNVSPNKIHATDLFDVFWIAPPVETPDFEILHY